MGVFRLLIDPPSDGVRNMARDEVLLSGVGAETAPPTLRFYRWDPPTISLGYFQPYADYQRLPPPAGKLAVVRRTTGGGAILHDREWTYSLALPSAHPLIAGRPTALYEHVHDALIDVLALLGVRAARCAVSDDSAAHRGPFFCFERRHCVDVVIGADKLAGSAQRRTPRAVLQHGSIVLARRYRQQQSAALQDHLTLSDESLLDPLIDALSRRLGVALHSGDWTADELQQAERLDNKYGGDAWLKRR